MTVASKVSSPAHSLTHSLAHSLTDSFTDIARCCRAGQGGWVRDARMCVYVCVVYPGASAFDELWRLLNDESNRASLFHFGARDRQDLVAFFMQDQEVPPSTTVIRKKLEGVIGKFQRGEPAAVLTIGPSRRVALSFMSFNECVFVNARRCCVRCLCGACCCLACVRLQLKQRRCRARNVACTCCTASTAR